MGISGLLPLLKSIQKPCNLKKFAGQTIGVDAYGWLHRGTVASAIDLALGKSTTRHVDFSMHRVRMLIHFGVTPYMVFDGDYLPSKAATEVERARKRKESKTKGLELYRLNKPSQAHLELQKAVDVTPEMARQLIEELKKIGVQYIVAPYEADAQLVYLERQGIIQGTLSEDSDLLVFGAKRLLTKLDPYGECIEINRADFTACREISLVGWSDTEFRRMAILSGCDYLASINRMGLKSAYRFVRKYKTIEKIVQMLQFDGAYYVPTGYLENFYKAELTFLHQRVFCPLKNDMVMMTELQVEAQPEDFSFIGGAVKQDVAIGVAKGELDPMTKQPFNIRNTAKTSPRTPWGNPRRNTVDTFLDVKTNRSIDSFFKSKRTPLAELDPNVFTPSPTQERILRQASGNNWESSPAPAVVQNIAPVPPILHPASSSTIARGTNAFLTRQSSGKRRKLCLDDDEDEERNNARLPELGRSRFFTSDPPVPNPLGKNERKGRRRKDTDFKIWSDDSVEEAMAQLAEVSHETSKGRQSNTAEKNKDSKESASTEKVKTGSIAADSQASTLSKPMGTNETSTETQASIVASPTVRLSETLDKHVTAELEALTSASTHQSETVNMTAQRKDIEKSVSSLRPETVGQIVRKSQLQRQQSMTPLQRLGASALHRLKSDVEITSNGQGALKALNESMSDDLSKASQPLQPLLPMVHSSTGSDACIARGSEDAFVPESEEDVSEDDSRAEEEAERRPLFDLGRFAFTG